MPEIPEILEVQHNRNVLAMISAFHPSIEHENITIREETIPVTDPQGGYITGTLETEDAISREICSQAHAVVVNVDYCKAPEYEYLVAVNDSWDALK
ncbi:hypothetical protein BZG36_05738 [Bifiguratus adelaidae]|uniref:Alpha/beta hydrolase fold-3 domain-containing protein n=1 Tax=Bifiguratus adelaidae TaxID=1938954 RepID=A0A261XTB0_9FUNG|nr:hypothetical protein BZG36_05738 [Bifiguratus adelaidae]